MPTHRLTHFSDPGVLVTISTDMLRALLVPFADELGQLGLEIPPADEEFRSDNDRLARLLVTAPDGLPDADRIAVLHRRSVDGGRHGWAPQGAARTGPALALLDAGRHRRAGLAARPRSLRAGVR